MNSTKLTTLRKKLQGCTLTSCLVMRGFLVLVGSLMVTPSCGHGEPHTPESHVLSDGA